MFHDTMIQDINILEAGLKELAKTLGMNQREIECILNRDTSRKEQLKFSMGPKPYWATGYYGTISIKDF